MCREAYRAEAGSAASIERRPSPRPGQGTFEQRRQRTCATMEEHRPARPSLSRNCRRRLGDRARDAPVHRALRRRGLRTGSCASRCMWCGTRRTERERCADPVADRRAERRFPPHERGRRDVPATSFSVVADARIEFTPLRDLNCGATTGITAHEHGDDRFPGDPQRQVGDHRRDRPGLRPLPQHGERRTSPTTCSASPPSRRGTAALDSFVVDTRAFRTMGTTTRAFQPQPLPPPTRSGTGSTSSTSGATTPPRPDQCSGTVMCASTLMEQMRPPRQSCGHPHLLRQQTAPATCT